MEEVVPDLEKRKKMIETYTKRQGVIISKFPKISEAPKSIQDEYYALIEIINAMQASSRTISGQTISSDGIPIDIFVKEKYEDALAKLPKFREENITYISPEEEANFEFLKIDFNKLYNEIEEVKTRKDSMDIYNKLLKLGEQPLPQETRKKLDEIKAKTLEAAKELREKEETTQSTETPVLPVTESKFAQIYGKAKGRIQEVFKKIKSFFQEKSHDKSNDDKDTESRE